MKPTANLFTIGVLAALACAQAPAQQYPSKPVRIVVPFPAGGSFDVTARIVAQRMQLGQNVLVENRPGGGTVIGTEYVARQPGDGYTILSIGPSFTMHHAVRSKVPFDTEKDFKAVAQAMGLNMAIAVNPSLPVKTMKEYLALAKARPGEISYGTSGPGTSHNMLGEALKLAQKVNVVHTPYQGEVPAVTSAVGGHITGVLVNLFSTAPFIKSGRLRGLVVTSSQRDALAPDVPTAREAGVPEGGSGHQVPRRVPARWRLPPQRAVGKGGVLYRGELSDGALLENPHTAEHPAVQIGLCETREVCARAEQTGMCGDAAQCEGVLVVDLTP